MFVADVTAYFAENPSNVAVIHCKGEFIQLSRQYTKANDESTAGKGRSGTMTCSYLLSLPKLPPSPQSSRNIGNKHDRQVLEKQREARKAGNQPDQYVTVSPGSESEMEAQNGDQEQKSKKLTARLDSVFEFHTSRRLKPSKSTASSTNASPRRSRNPSTSCLPLRDTTAASSSEIIDMNTIKGHSPLRLRRSLSNLVGTLSCKASWLGMEAPLSSVDADGATQLQKTSRLRLNTKSTTNLRALGACPAGTSSLDLNALNSAPLSNGHDISSDHLALSSSNNIRSSESSATSTQDLEAEERRKGRSQLSIPNGDEKKEAKSRSTSPSFTIGQGIKNSPGSSNNQLQDTLPRSGNPEEYKEAAGEDEVEIPKMAVSIPSQRRWVGYWARMLAEMDPRAALDSNMMHPNRRKVKILRILVDRRVIKVDETNKMEGYLRVQIARYNARLVERLENWERVARRKQRAFGAVDPGAPSTEILPLEGENEDKGDQDFSEITREMKVARRKEEEKRWKDCEKRNLDHHQEYDRRLRQHGNDTGVGQWGINVMAERETLRHFDWEDEKGSLAYDQMETVAMASEAGRTILPKSKASPLLSKPDLTAKTSEEPSILQYIFKPSEADTTHYGHKTPQMTWTKPSSTSDGLAKLVRGILSGSNRSSITKQQGSHQTSPLQQKNPSNSSSDTSHSRYTDRTNNQTSTIVTDPPSAKPSDELLREGKGQQPGLIIDADREISLKVLLGRTGATHSKLPDLTSAGYLWFIPAFETPTLVGKKSPMKGQIVQCQFGIGEIDFRKGKNSLSLMGGGDIRSITVEFEWIEVGWHEANENSDE